MIDDYVPFLKLKTNEVAALAEIDDKYKEIVTPFFDLPRRKEMTDEDVVKVVSSTVGKIKRYLGYLRYFYVDDFDIDETIEVNGKLAYQYTLEEYKGFPFVPVVALDRSDERNDMVFDGKNDGLIISDRVAIRLQLEDFESFALTEFDLKELTERCLEVYEVVDLVLDCRICYQHDGAALIKTIVAFLDELSDNGLNIYGSYIIAGSSIPASIGDIVSVNSQKVVLRRELEVFMGVNLLRRAKYYLSFGDYGIVSPDYSDLDIIPEAMRNVTAPKILYSYDMNFYIARGAGLKTHPRGDQQYNDMCAVLVSEPFYRGVQFSFGDKYLDEKANNQGTGVTPSSILKPTINAHLTHMLSLI